MAVIQRRLRWISFVLGAIVLFWLPVEDTNLTFVTILAICICVVGAVWTIRKYGFRFQVYRWVGLGAGFLVGPLGCLLMLLKIGLHHHPRPDFTIHQLFQLILISPIWAISGFLLGWGIELYYISKGY